MPPTQVIFNVEVEDNPAQHLLDDVMLAVSTPSLMEFLQDDASDFFRNDIESRFVEEGDVKSGFWPPLSESTVRIREELGYGSEPINRRTDDMFEFLTGPYQVFGGAGWAELQIPGNPPDPIMQRKLQTAASGSPPGNNPLFPNSATPPRPVLAVSEMDLARLLEMLQIHIIHKVIGSLVI